MPQMEGWRLESGERHFSTIANLTSALHLTIALACASLHGLTCQKGAREQGGNIHFIKILISWGTLATDYNPWHFGCYLP